MEIVENLQDVVYGLNIFYLPYSEHTFSKSQTALIQNHKNKSLIYKKIREFSNEHKNRYK